MYVYMGEITFLIFVIKNFYFTNIASNVFILGVNTAAFHTFAR